LYSFRRPNPGFVTVRRGAFSHLGCCSCCPRLLILPVRSASPPECTFIARSSAPRTTSSSCRKVTVWRRSSCSFVTATPSTPMQKPPDNGTYASTANQLQEPENAGLLPPIPVLRLPVAWSRAALPATPLAPLIILLPRPPRPILGTRPLFFFVAARDQLGRRVYLPHRLDRGTSGCLLLGFSPEAVKVRSDAA